MNKEQLIALGVTEELAEKVLAAYKQAIDGNFIPKDRFNTVNTENQQLKASLTERDGQLEALKTVTGGVDKLKQQIADLQTANVQKEKEYAAELKHVKREALDERLLTEAKAINPIAVKPFLSAIDAGVDDEGYMALRKQHIEALTKADSTKFLFSAADVAGAKLAGLKPGESGDGGIIPGGLTNPFAKDTYDEAAQIKLFRENPELAKAMAKQAGIKFI
jgi:hypothetical protein